MPVREDRLVAYDLVPPLEVVGDRQARGSSRQLWAIVILTDLLALVAGWMLPALIACGEDCSPQELRILGLSALMVPVTLGWLALSDAYGPGAWMLYSVEVSRLNKAVIGSALIFFMLLLSTGVVAPLGILWRAALVMWMLGSFRGIRRRWVSRQRNKGRFITRVLLVGSGHEAEELYHLFKDHPEIGYRLCGLVPSGRLVPQWSEDIQTFAFDQDWGSAARSCSAGAVLIDAEGLDARELQEKATELAGSGLQVRLASGFEGWGAGTRKSVPLAYESMYDVVPSNPPAWELALKRSLDLVLGSVCLVLALPVMVTAALAIRIFDGSPVFIRQQRVGRFGRLFTMLKLRTMVVNAESRLPEVLPMNMRDGPLFKADADPRITPLGRFLRAASIDEIPQLINVIRGSMSLVGPRPSLPDECQNFDGTLRLRERVPPGLSGLWQVEARDMPSFRAYRRLDLYYIQNWSLGLDLAIVMVTPVVVAARGWRAITRVVSRGRKSSSLTLLD
jgi:exopolysaccharide biosynthesis polyprenyl glycosylphosphotransferase